MKLVVAPGATVQIMARKRWWRANRSEAPERFDDELAAALVKIAERPATLWDMRIRTATETNTSLTTSTTKTWRAS